MALETGTYISDLVVTNPVGATDPKSQGDEHLRLLKSTIKATFPNLTGAVTPTHTELNYVDGVTSAIQTQLDARLGSGGALGTPSSGTLTNCTGLPAAGVTGTAAILGANTFTADQALGNNDITGVKTIGFTAEYDNGNSSTADTITLANGQYQKSTLTNNTTLTISTTGATVGAYYLRLIQDVPGSRTVTWVGLDDRRWLGSAATPAINSSTIAETMIVMFFDGVNLTQRLYKVGAA